MRVVGDFVVSELYQSKTGAVYLSLVDLSNGGTLKVKVDGVPEVKNGEIVHMEADVRGRLYNGSQSLDFERGAFTRKG